MLHVALEYPVKDGASFITPFFPKRSSHVVKRFTLQGWLQITTGASNGQKVGAMCVPMVRAPGHFGP